MDPGKIRYTPARERSVPAAIWGRDVFDLGLHWPRALLGVEGARPKSIDSSSNLAAQSVSSSLVVFALDPISSSKLV